MKPAKFDYYDPKSLEEALALLDCNPDDAKVLAGGQSLMPLLNMRLARPNIVVDINQIKELNYVRASDGGIAIGAIARQRALQTETLIAERVPILQEAAYYIAHRRFVAAAPSAAALRTPTRRRSCRRWRWRSTRK